VTGRLLVVYNQASKRPDDAAGRTAQPVALVQRAGPSNGGDAKQVSGPPVVRTGSSDNAEDAFPRWTTGDGLFGSPVVRQPGGDNQPALDLLDVQVGPEVDLETGEPVADGGFTVTMKYADLSPEALNAALPGGVGTSLVYLFRFFDGFESGGAMAYYEPARGGFRFGETDYQRSEANVQGNVQTYEPERAIAGAVDQENGTIRLSVPRDRIEALGPLTGDGPRPTEIPAVTGSRVYDASAWTFVNPLPVNDEQSFLSQADNTAAFDFVIQDAVQQAGPGGSQGGGDGSGTGGTGSGRGGALAATGGLGVPLLALVAMVGAGAAWRRARS
jgi:hypothetical protein